MGYFCLRSLRAAAQFVEDQLGIASGIPVARIEVDHAGIEARTFGENGAYRAGDRCEREPALVGFPAVARDHFGAGRDDSKAG